MHSILSLDYHFPNKPDIDRSIIMFLFHLAAPLLLFMFLFLILPLYLRQRKNKLPPGPKRLPIIGNLHQLGTFSHRSLAKMSAEHGPLMSLQLGSVPAIVVSSAAALRSIFPAHDLTFSGRPVLYASEKFSYGLSDITFAPYGDYWREARKICVVKLFSSKRVESFCAAREEEVASMVLSIVNSVSSFHDPGPDQPYGKPQNASRHPGLDQTVDLSQLMHSLANDLTCRIAFGKKYGRDRSELRTMFAETQDLLACFCVADCFPWLWWVPAITGFQARLEKNFKELDIFYDEVIEEHLREPEAEHEDLVHVLLRLHEDPTHGVIFNSTKHIKGIITDIFIAGTDTSSATLVWAMTELMRNPRVMNKLRREVGEAVSANGGKLEETALQRVDYLKQVIKEVLRLHPAAPLLVPRETIESCRVDGYEIPAGTRVFINAAAIAMDPKCWENPKEFRPERFSGDEIDFTGPGFEMVPFGMGRRICPGVRTATALVELALASLVYNFEWEMPDGMEPDDLDLDELPGIAVHKKIPLRLVAKPISL